MLQYVGCIVNFCANKCLIPKYLKTLIVLTLTSIIKPKTPNVQLDIMYLKNHYNF